MRKIFLYLLQKNVSSALLGVEQEKLPTIQLFHPNPNGHGSWYSTVSCISYHGSSISYYGSSISGHGLS